MNETQPKGGAASSLGAHSKDGAQQNGGNPKDTTHDRERTGAAAQESGNQSHGSWTSGAAVAEQAREGLERAKSAARDAAETAREGYDRAKSTARDAAEQARETITTHGSHAMESTGRMVRDQPLMALAVTGLACFAIGVLVGRGRD
jgi:ElaB/YqjD/DUF883 family membrane-anchored ribosome-binding protein